MMWERVGGPEEKAWYSPHLLFSLSSVNTSPRCAQARAMLGTEQTEMKK